MLLEHVVSLVNLGMRRTGLAPGTEDERDPQQVRLAIEAIRVVLPLIEQVAPEQVAPIKDALSQLQMAFVRIGGQGRGRAARRVRVSRPPAAIRLPAGRKRTPAAAPRRAAVASGSRASRPRGGTGPFSASPARLPRRKYRASVRIEGGGPFRSSAARFRARPLPN